MTIPRTALVLGGGGITGIAWEIGLLAGLAEAGADLTQAETVVGTSAGSVVGVQVAAGDNLEAMYARQLKRTPDESAWRLGKGMALRYLVSLLLPGRSHTKRARLGRAALSADTGDESTRLDVFRNGLGEREWPRGRLLITAVNAENGAFEVFDKDSGVALVRAVASSCAVPLVWPPVSVNGGRYMDGGMRSPTNADLAKGADRVVVLAPLTTTYSRAARVESQLGSLGAGVRSTVVTPDRCAKRAIGNNVLDPAQRAASAEAGREQSRRVLEQVRSVWAAD